MKISTWNVNGIRSSYEKGLKTYVENFHSDILCLQEIKAQEALVPCFPLEYNKIVNPATKNGYAGTAVLSKKIPKSVNLSLGYDRFDNEGRFMEVEYDDFLLINLYMPHGGRKFENLEYKIDAYRVVLEYLGSKVTKPIVLVGDLNIAHNEIDLARPKHNIKNIMFTQAERSTLTKLQDLKFIDALRKFNSEPGVYTWWPYAFNARERNIGWRIDYIWVSECLDKNLSSCVTRPDIKGSDHCPVECELFMNKRDKPS